jgi:hypothetical protein
MKILLSVLVLFFAGFLLYANWRPPSLGERLYMENPTQIVVFSFPASYTARDSAAMKTYFASKQGVYSSVVTLCSQTLCVTIDPRKTNRSAMLEAARGFDPGVRERVMKAGPQCPVDGPLYTLQKVKYALCFRK